MSKSRAKRQTAQRGESARTHYADDETLAYIAALEVKLDRMEEIARLGCSCTWPLTCPVCEELAALEEGGGNE